MTEEGAAPHRTASLSAIAVALVIDTNTIWTGPTRFASQALTALTRRRFERLTTSWHIPAIARLERRYQMVQGLSHVLESRSQIEFIAGQSVQLTPEQVEEAVDRQIGREVSDLGLADLACDPARVDWERVLRDAVERRLPFTDSAGAARGAEKGFRDRVIGETFLQFMASRTNDSTRERVGLVTADKDLRGFVAEQSGGRQNVVLLSDLTETENYLQSLDLELKGTSLEAFRQAATSQFYVAGDERTFFHTLKVLETIREKFSKELKASPPLTRRENTAFTISPPIAVDMRGGRTYWKNQVTFVSTLTRTLTKNANDPGYFLPAGTQFEGGRLRFTWPGTVSGNTGWSEITGLESEPTPERTRKYAELFFANSVLRGEVRDAFEVTWSAAAIDGHLADPALEDVRLLSTERSQLY